MSKVYAKLSLTEQEFKAFHSLAITARKDAFYNWRTTADGPEKEFYSQRVDEWDALIAAKFSKVLIADKSQDSGPDDWPEEE